MRKKELLFKVENENTLSEELKLNLSRRFYRHLKTIEANIYVNDELRKNFEKVYPGDIIRIQYEELEKECNWPKVDSLPKIVFENDHYLIVNKEPNILTIPTMGNPYSLYQQLVTYLNSTSIHILNRLDKETSGLVVVAKDRYAASLLEPTHEHMVRKYKCLVKGIVGHNGRIENYIVNSEDSNKRYVSDEKKGQIAISNFNVLKKYKDTTLLEFILETGRTHQIRVHTSNMGHPIIGDKMYGNKDDSSNLHLTSYYVEFIDPFTGEKISKSIDENW